MAVRMDDVMPQNTIQAGWHNAKVKKVVPIDLSDQEQVLVVQFETDDGVKLPSECFELSREPDTDRKQALFAVLGIVGKRDLDPATLINKSLRVKVSLEKCRGQSFLCIRNFKGAINQNASKFSKSTS